MHPDHALGAAFFAEAGAKVVGHRRSARALAARTENYIDSLRNTLGEAALIGTTSVHPEEAEGSIDLGGRRLRLVQLPTGHTDNDLLVLDETSGVLFTGDVVFDGHVPALDGSITGWLAVLDALPEAKLIVPGHGSPLKAVSGPEATRRYLAVLARDVRRAIADGAPIGDAAERAGLSEREKWQLFDDFNARNATAAFKELEWE